jgi:hypothetical protein
LYKKGILYLFSEADMKLFNYEKIYLGAHGNSDRMIELFYQGVPGSDFIVNPKALVDAFWVSNKHKAEYLGLCSLRSYSHYLKTKQVDLDVGLIPPWVPLSVVSENPLIKLTENTIIFIKEK